MIWDFSLAHRDEQCHKVFCEKRSEAMHLIMEMWYQIRILFREGKNTEKIQIVLLRHYESKAYSASTICRKLEKLRLDLGVIKNESRFGWPNYQHQISIVSRVLEDQTFGSVGSISEDLKIHLSMVWRMLVRGSNMNRCNLRWIPRSLDSSQQPLG
jgi:hypothetical protein